MTKTAGKAVNPKTTAAPKTRRAPVSAVTGAAPKPVQQQNPTVVDGPQPVILGPVMRKKELVDTVVAHSGMKKKDVKPVVESMLAVLGDALSDNRELILPPLGRMKVRREKKLPNGRMVVVKIRQNDKRSNADTEVASDTAE